MQLPKPLSHRTGELGDVAGTLATHHCQLCQHLLAGRVRITPHSPGHACHQSLLKLLCAILRRVGGGVSPLGAERQMGRITFS